MGTTRILATFIKHTSFRDIPQDAISTAKYLVLDVIGVALAAGRVPGARIAMQYVREQEARPIATVIGGGGLKTTAAEAAWCNAILGHCLEYEDAWPETMHPSSMILPACLAVAEQCSVSGKRLLEGYLLGLEVIAKIATSSPNITHTRGWHGSSVYGAIAAAAGTAKILDLDVDGICCALGIAASGASGLIRQHGTMAKWHNQGNAARQGVMAALLAKKGYTADMNILEGAGGFMEVFHADGGYRLGTVERVGKPFHIVSPGASIRTYPCAYVHHGPIDTLLDLLRTLKVSYEEVEEVIIPLTPKQYLRNNAPLTGRSIRENLRFPMAIALRHGELKREDFTEENLWSSTIQGALAKIRITELDSRELPEGTDPARYQPAVVLRLKDGREFVHRLAYPRGRYDDPTPKSEFALPKFRDSAKDSLSDSEVERCIDLVQRLEELEQLRSLTDLISGSDQREAETLKTRR